MPSAIHKPSRDTSFLDLFESGGSLSAAQTEDPEALYAEYREIGHGNFGSVYYAVEKMTNEVVAVKKMSISSTNSLKDSKQKYDDVCREIRTLKTLSQHTNLLAFRKAHYDAKQGLILLVTEYCLGSCADMLETVHEIEEYEIAAIITQCLTGLAHVHARGAIHRDVKASNILIAERGVVKLADFGSASSSPTANSFVGTPFWIAPEVILAMDTGQYDTRADVWSLGITCHELVDGRPPYFSLNPMSALYQIAHNEPPQLAVRRKPQRDARRSGLLRTTHQDDQHRFPTRPDEPDGNPDTSDSSEADDGDQPMFSDAFRNFVALCLLKDPARRPYSDWLLANHAFVVRDEARATRITFELLERTRRALSVGDPLKHRRIRENFNTESAGTHAPFEYAPPQFVADSQGPESAMNGARDRHRPQTVSNALSRSSSVAERSSRAVSVTPSADSSALNVAMNELDAVHLQLRRFSTAAVAVAARPEERTPHSRSSNALRDALRDALPDASTDTDADLDVDASSPQISLSSRQYAAALDADAKFSTLKTKNMLRRELEESQKYVSIREKFAALKRLRTIQLKEVRALELRGDAELHDLRIRLARAQEDSKREAQKEAARLDERQRAESERRERESSGAWKRCTSSLHKLRKRTLNAASGAKFGSLTKAKAANRSAIEAVSSAEARLKALERLNLMATHKFAAQSAAELRGRRELALASEQVVVQAQNEEAEKAQLTHIDSVYRLKLAHLERQFEMERDNHATFFRSEAEKLARAHERLTKELSKSRKSAEAGCKRDTELIVKAVDRDLRGERARIEADNSLSKTDRETATRSAKDRFERRRVEEVGALRRRVDAEQTVASRQLEAQCNAEIRAHDQRMHDELALLTRGQEEARANLEAEHAARLQDARRQAAARQRDIDARCAAEREALRERCDTEAVALRDAHRSALRDFDARALADLTTQHCALVSSGAAQYSSSANLQQSGGGSQQSASASVAAFCNQLYYGHVHELAPHNLEALSAAELHELVLHELERFCSSDNVATQLPVAMASQHSQQLTVPTPPGTDLLSSSETSSSVDTASVPSSTLERPHTAASSSNAQPQPSAASRVKKMSLGNIQQPVFTKPQPEPSPNGIPNVRLRNESQPRPVDANVRAKRSSMVVLSGQQTQLIPERDRMPYDYNGAMPRGALAGTPPKAFSHVPGSTSNHQLSSSQSSSSFLQQSSGQSRPVWPPSMAASGGNAHLYVQHGPGLQHAAKPVSGSAGRHAGLEMQQRVAALNGGSGGSGSPASTTSGGSRQSIAAQVQRRLFGLFGSSHNVNEPSAAPVPTSDSIPVNLHAGMNVPRNRHSMNVNYGAVPNFSLSGTPRANDGSDHSQI